MKDQPHGGGPSVSRRSILLAAPFVLGRAATWRDLAAAGTADIGPATKTAEAPPEAVPSFPLGVEPGRRYFVDASGRPFLIHGDAAWSLIAQLSREDVERYLDDRRARGFNTILVSLIEHRYSSRPPENAYGDQPFNGALLATLDWLANLIPLRQVAEFGTSVATLFADYASPNEVYFAHADWVLRRAAERGFLVLLAPSYLGYHGGMDGWYYSMAVNGTDRLRKYGEYLGQRYRDHANIMWVNACDYNPPDKSLVRAIAEGIREFDQRALHTAHCAPETAAIEYWQDEPWLEANTIYTYGSVHAAALRQYARPERMPCFLIEGAYENGPETTECRLRTQAYQAVLCGMTGQIFGNAPIWHFDGPGIHPVPMTWRQALDSAGARSMTHLRDLMVRVPWWRLEPDIDHTLLTDGLGEEHERAVAARTADGSMALLYLPTSREVTVDLSRLTGGQVSASWYDPANGRATPVTGSPFQAIGPRLFRPRPGGNSSGLGDWVLVLAAQPRPPAEM